MKMTLKSILCACILSTAAIAIPQTFNGGFFGAVGQQFEDFAIAAVAPGAELKGKWVAVAKEDGKLRLALDAVVLGIPASEITAEKTAGGATKFTVTYKAGDDRKRGKAAAPLKTRILGALRAYTGAEAAPGKPVDYKGARFTVAETKGDVSVETTKAP